MSLLWDPTLTAWRPHGDLAPVVERALHRLRQAADEVAASRGHDVVGEDVREWVKGLCEELGPAAPVCPPALGGRVVVWSWEDGGAVAYEQAEALTLALPGALPLVLLPDMWRALDGEELEAAKRAAADEVLRAEGLAGMEEAEERWKRERVSGALVATDEDEGAAEVGAPSEHPASCEACRRHPVCAVFEREKAGAPTAVCLGCLEQSSVRARRRKWRTVA